MMRLGIVAALFACACSDSQPTTNRGHLVVAVTVDWEGIAITDEALAALDALRANRTVPITHFVSAAYFTRPGNDTAVAALRRAVRPGDELAVHLHAWSSLVEASGVEPKLAPSFLTGTDELAEVDPTDPGFDTDLDTYETPELRAMLRTTRSLLESTDLRVSSSFRAGGYLATPKVLSALRNEGYTVDSSATPQAQFGNDYGMLRERVRGLWPNIDAGAQPYLLRDPAGDIVELPIAALADTTPADKLALILERAGQRLRLQPGRDVFVVLAFHFETAAEYGGRIGQALDLAKARPELARELHFTTVEDAATLARATIVQSDQAVP